jgi:FAD/FMN-containing dehydrogenase
MNAPQPLFGEIYERGSARYEAARREAVWNELKPDRFPQKIVRVAREEDVVNAVRLARREGLKVKAKGGGHSFTASHVRDGLLVDFTDYREITVDPVNRRATVTPSVQGTELNDRLREHGLFFPSGHCAGVGLGGYLLQGGFGWNGRELGPACASLRAIDVVTAEGELLHSSDEENPEFVWAARGSGPGFFGVVTRFHLDVHPLPDAIAFSIYQYPMEVYEALVPWFLETSAAAPRNVEPLLHAGQSPTSGEPSVDVMAMAFAAGQEEAEAELAAFDAGPCLESAEIRSVAVPTTLNELYAMLEPALPAGHRYCVDGMWTEASPAALTPELHELFTSRPTAKSSVVLMPWAPTEVENGVFSLQADLYVSPMAIWEDEDDDDRCIRWPGEQMERLEHLALGIQLADENLINRPAPFLAADRLARLEELRTQLDPDGLFHGYLIGGAAAA